jgi:hypothetical protein
MTPWIVRALAAGVLLSLAALAADRGAAWLGRPRRWLWAAAMAGTLAFPLGAAWLPDLLPNAPAAAGATPAWVIEAAPAAAPLPGASTGAPFPGRWRGSPRRAP